MSARIEWSRWTGIALTMIIALVAFAVQWGMVMTKLGHVEQRLDAFIIEARVLRVGHHDIERRVSFLEGLTIGQTP